MKSSCVSSEYLPPAARAELEEVHEVAVFELSRDAHLDLFFPGGRVLLEEREEVVEVAAVFRRGELNLVDHGRFWLRELDVDFVDD